MNFHVLINTVASLEVKHVEPLSKVCSYNSGL